MKAKRVVPVGRVSNPSWQVEGRVGNPSYGTQGHTPAARAFTLPRALAACGLLTVAVVLFSVPACEQAGRFSFLGYSTRPNYNMEIKTVRVPIFKNQTYLRGIEFDVTQALIREIEQKTPYKVVVADCPTADTELLGNIVATNKAIVNFNQLGEVRDSEMYLTAEIIWRDLRAGHTGDVLSVPLQQPGQPPPVPLKQGQMPAPVVVQAIASFQPELGGSRTTALAKCTNRMAEQIVSMMEKGW